jgi:hypothetical protein
MNPQNDKRVVIVIDVLDYDWWDILGMASVALAVLVYL